MPESAPPPDNLADRVFAKSIRVRMEGDTLKIGRRLLRIESAVVTALAPLPGLIVVCFVPAIVTGRYLIWILSALFSFVALLSFLYFLAMALLNESLLRLTPERLEVTNGPIPWPFHRLHLATPDIFSVGVVEKIHQAYEQAERHTTYHLQLTMKSGTKKQVFRPFSKREHAETVQALIAAHLQKIR